MGFKNKPNSSLDVPVVVSGSDLKAGIKVGDADVGDANPVPVNIQVESTEVTSANPIPVKNKFRQLSYIIPLIDIGAWSGFTNQPDGHKVGIISNSASDTGKITIFGTIKTTGAFHFETITLTGTTVVETTQDDWGNIYGAFMGDIYGKNITPAVGTITIREASADQTITTIAATEISKGMVCFNLQSCDVTINIQSGSVWIDDDVVTTVIGFKYIANMADDLQVSEYLYFISDSTGATMQIKVLG